MTYQSSVLADNPIHFWRLNEQPGALNAYDWGSTKRLLNTVTTVETISGSSIVPNFPGFSSGFGWQGITADGGGYATQGLDLVARPDSSNPDPNIAFPFPGTIEAWFLQQDLQGGTFVGFFNPFLGTGQQNHGIWAIGNRFQPLFFNSTTGVFITKPTDALYHMAALTFDSSGWHFYLDGSAAGSGTLSSTPLAGAFAWAVVGVTHPQTGATPQPALVTEVAVFDHVLSNGQVDAHFNAADKKNVFPQYKGVPPPTGLGPPSGVTAGTVHAGLTTQGEIILASNYAIGSLVTIIPANIGQALGDPTFYFDLGWLTAITANGVAQTFRIDRTQQMLTLPLFTTAVGFSFSPGVVVTLTEFSATP